MEERGKGGGEGGGACARKEGEASEGRGGGEGDSSCGHVARPDWLGASNEERG